LRDFSVIAIYISSLPPLTRRRSMNSGSEITLLDLFSAALRQRWLIAGVTLIAACSSIALYKALPRKYGSEGSLYVQVGRANIGLDPTTNSKPISIQDSRETEIRSVLEIARSQSVLRRVVDQVGAEAILAGGWKILDKLPSLLSSGQGDFDGMTSEEYRTQKTRELAVRELQSNLSISLEKNTSVISVFAASTSPKLSQAIVEKLMAETRGKHLEIHATGSSRKIFQQELIRQQEQLDRATEKLRDFRNQHGFLSVDAAKSTEQAVLDKLELQLSDVDAELSQVDRRVQELQSKLADIPELLETPVEGKERLSTEKALSDMFALETERAKLLATYSEEHPKVIQITGQIESLREELGDLPEERTELAAVPNKTYENVKTELVSATAALEGLKGKKLTLSEQRRETDKRLTELNQLDTESQVIQREIDIARRQLQLYIEKQGEAQILDQLDQERISDVVVAQPAVLMVKHVSPNPVVLLPACTLLGFVLGCLGALLREWPLQGASHTSKKDNTPEQLDDLPVLVNLPEVELTKAAVR
jgi:uncharacterized protein involved in exopolysaccharide biosynthesis